MGSVSFSSFGKWVVLPQVLKKWVTRPLCQQKMGSLQRQQISNNHETHTTCM